MTTDQPTFAPSNFPEELFIKRKVSRCQHPWDNISVNGGFFVDAKDVKTAPSVPKRLTDMGVVFEYAKLDNDLFPGTVNRVSGWLFKRIK